MIKMSRQRKLSAVFLLVIIILFADTLAKRGIGVLV